MLEKTEGTINHNRSLPRPLVWAQSTITDPYPAPSCELTIEEEEEEEEYFITNFGPTRSNMKNKHMTIGMQNKLQNKNREKGLIEEP